MSTITNIKNIEPYITKDGSQIFELMHPGKNPCQYQSLALAVISSGKSTKMHKHHTSEEIYHVLSGTGSVTLDIDRFEIVAGDTICILPGVAHCVENTGQSDLKILCSCSPPYDHDDTEVLLTE